MATPAISNTPYSTFVPRHSQLMRMPTQGVYITTVLMIMTINRNSVGPKLPYVSLNSPFSMVHT